MSDGTTSYYVKIRGRTLGPFTADRLRQMAQQGQLSRINLISNDGQDWVKAGEFPTFFEGASLQARAAASTPAPEAVAVASVPEANHQAKAEWHYAIGAEQHGPVTFGQIRGMVANGTLPANELVWKEGMSDWEPVATVRELAASLPQREEPTRRRHTRRERTEREATGSLKPIQDSVRAGSAWAFFIVITAYVFSGLMFFSSVATMIVGAREQVGVVIAQGVVNLLIAGVFVTATIFFNRYASTAARFAATTDLEDLNSSLRWLSRLWLFLGIVLILFLTLVLISIIYAIAIGADLSNYKPY